jgi:hypothetical protein
LSVLTRQCLADRIASQPQVTTAATAWTSHRNDRQIGVDWQFTTADTRTKLKRLYPKTTV